MRERKSWLGAEIAGRARPGGMEVNLAPSAQALFELHYKHMHLNKTLAAPASKDADKPAS